MAIEAESTTSVSLLDAKSLENGIDDESKAQWMQLT